MPTVMGLSDLEVRKYTLLACICSYRRQVRQRFVTVNLLWYMFWNHMAACHRLHVEPMVYEQNICKFFCLDLIIIIKTSKAIKGKISEQGNFLNAYPRKKGCSKMRLVEPSTAPHRLWQENMHRKA